MQREKGHFPRHFRPQIVGPVAVPNEVLGFDALPVAHPAR